MPSTATDRLQGLTTSVAVKPACRVATTGPITLSGLQTIDGVTVAARDRVLVKDQADARENGIYMAQTNEWTRALDFDGAFDAVGGTQTMVLAGSLNANTYWRVAGEEPVVFGTSDIEFEEALLTDSATAAFIQSGTGAVVTTTQTKLRRLQVDIEDFGGGTDKTGAQNYEAMESALALLGGGDGGIVQLGAGLYEFERTVGHTLPNNVVIRGRGKNVTFLQATDALSLNWFNNKNGEGNAFLDFTAIGNNVATAFLVGGFYLTEQDEDAIQRCAAGYFSNVELRNFKGDGWIAALQTGNPPFDLLGPYIEGNCSFRSQTGNTRGPSDIGIPQGVIWVQGNITPGSTTRLRKTYIGPVQADIPHCKGLAVFALGVDGAQVDHPTVERCGTIGIDDDSAGYCILYLNETEGAPNVDNLVIEGLWLKQGKSAGIYGANWGGFGGSLTIRNCLIERLTDTDNSTLAKGAVAFADSNMTYLIENLEAKQCVSAIDARLAAGATLSVNGVRHTNYAAIVAPKSENNTGNGVFTLDPVSPVLSGHSVGNYRVVVTSGGGTNTPTFTVYSPSGATVGTYTVGGSAFATQIGFTIADGSSNFATDDEFIVHVFEDQPASNQVAVNIGKKGGAANAAPTGDIALNDLYIRDQGSGTRGIRIRGETSGGTLQTFGRIQIGDLDIVTVGAGFEAWGENDNDIINPYTKGVYFVGGGLIKSQTSYGFRMRALSSEVIFGGSYVISRGDGSGSAAPNCVDVEHSTNINVKAAALTLSGQGANASDAAAWNGASAQGTIAKGGISFLNTANAYRATGLGTAKPGWTPSPNADGHVVDNLAKTVATGQTIDRWEYIDFAWQIIRVDAATS